VSGDKRQGFQRGFKLNQQTTGRALQGGFNLSQLTIGWDFLRSFELSQLTTGRAFREISNWVSWIWQGFSKESKLSQLAGGRAFQSNYKLSQLTTGRAFPERFQIESDDNWVDNWQVLHEQSR
jgi:hypothetical protein